MIRLLVAALAALVFAVPAEAEDNYAELWLHPGFARDLDDKSFIEVETQQRFRDGPADNQFVGRIWYGRKLGGGVTFMGGVHRGWEGERRENRLMQQLSYPLVGILKGRTRLEQRFLNDDPRTAWRLRQRLGVSVPVTSIKDGWELAANAEGFFTLRAGEAGGDTGLTGLRTFVGFEREYDAVEVSAGYTRQQNIREGGPDRVGHAPTLALTFKI